MRQLGSQALCGGSTLQAGGEKGTRPEVGAGVVCSGHGGGTQRDRKAADQAKTKHSLSDRGPCFRSVFTHVVESVRTETGKILSPEESVSLRPHRDNMDTTAAQPATEHLPMCFMLNC